MQPFTILTGVAAPLLRDNIDTEIIIRIERVTGTARDSMGAVAFETWRFQPDGSEEPDFVLNQPAYRGAPILITGANFGCGSSREGAVWAIMGLGVRCIVAESFGDIFFNNCFQNGLLPVCLPRRQIDALAVQCIGRAVTVDLVEQRLVTPGGDRLPFEIEPLRKQALLGGLDEIGLTLQHAGAIAAYQAADRIARPWIWL